MINNWARVFTVSPYARRAPINMSRAIRFYGANSALQTAMRGLTARVNVQLDFNTSGIRQQIERIVNEAISDGRVSTERTGAYGGTYRGF